MQIKKCTLPSPMQTTFINDLQAVLDKYKKERNGKLNESRNGKVKRIEVVIEKHRCTKEVLKIKKELLAAVQALWGLRGRLPLFGSLLRKEIMKVLNSQDFSDAVLKAVYYEYKGCLDEHKKIEKERNNNLGGISQYITELIKENKELRILKSTNDNVTKAEFSAFKDTTKRIMNDQQDEIGVLIREIDKYRIQNKQLGAENNELRMRLQEAESNGSRLLSLNEDNDGMRQELSFFSR